MNKPSQNNDEETPLHVAARLGIPELVGLYAAQGADVNVLNARMETPLITAAFWAMDAREQTYSEQHHLVCRMLLDYGANPNLQDESKKTALHQASWNCDEALMQILLDAGTDPKIMDMNGCAALQYVLNMMQMRPYCVPYRCFQLLLNNGAARVYPKLFHKVQVTQFGYATIANLPLKNVLIYCFCYYLFESNPLSFLLIRCCRFAMMTPIQLR